VSTAVCIAESLCTHVSTTTTLHTQKKKRKQQTGNNENKKLTTKKQHTLQNNQTQYNTIKKITWELLTFNTSTPPPFNPEKNSD
jgi:hypothetical protein